jgi:lipopolysaccharide export system permease protein
LRIGKKEKDERSISDILIYDHQLNRNNTKMIMAKTGTMGYSADKRFLVMELKDGSRYEELQGRTTKTNAYPFTRTNFKSYETVFDMKQFELDKTDQDAFKTHQSMLNIKQLSAAIDSIDMNIKRRKKGFDEYILPYFYFRIPIKPPHLFTHQKPPARASFLAIFPKEERGNIANRAVNSARNIYDYARVTQEDLRLVGVNRNEHFNEWHRKFSLAISCLMFLFIGAPMGAIIRKGGFGWPILISILFFVVFIILSMTGEKLAKDFTLAPFFGMWLANFILFPFGMFLTYKAMRESQLIDLDGIMAFIKRIGLFFTKKKTTK